MGISGLLPLLKSIHKPCSLKKFAGQTIGVDAYGWLHRGTAACAIDLALDKPTTKYVDFAMSRVRMLIHFGITPYIVFDGDYLPSKAGTEKERASRRKESKRLGLELLNMGKTSQAHLELQKSVDVTPEMARLLIEELKYHNIQYVVAPYEADSQLTYLEKKGIISGILSEDSDLLVFGAKCLITKLDKYGECIEVNRNLFTACREVSFAGWSDADFRRMAMLSGCDYLPGIGKMGLKTAHRMLRKHKTVDRLVKAAQFDGQLKVPPGFMDAFHQAEMTFLYQWVFCPLANKLVNLNTPEHGIDIPSMTYIGQMVPSDIAVGVANGNLHPHTKAPIFIEPFDRSRTKPLKPARQMAPPAQTPDLKHSKPIDTFFRPKRTPLAELDPNSFTPSPSQQILLQQQQNSSSWAAVLAPVSQPRRRPSISGTAPQLSRRSITDPHRRASAPHAVKRQRLCTDNLEDTPISTQGESGRSRFFASSMTEPSPSLRNAKKKAKTRHSHDFELYSDDSIEDAMAGFADLEEAMLQPKKKIPIFHDEPPPRLVLDSQTTVSSTNTEDNSQSTAKCDTPGTSQGSLEAEDTEESVFSAALSSRVKDLRSRFSFGAHTIKDTTSTDAIAGKVLSAKQPSQRSQLHLVKPLVKSSEQRLLTPTRKRGTPERSGPSISVKEVEVDTSAEVESGVVLTASEVEVVGSSPMRPPTPHKFEVQGSEDLLVPDSEVESECSPQKPTLNLGRFAFSG